MPSTSWLRRLDFLPTWAAWALGLGAGALAGAALAGGTPRLVGALGFLGLLSTAAALAWSGEPVAILEVTESAPRQAPEPVSTSHVVDLVPIPAGTFSMGSPDAEEGHSNDEGPVHEVWVSSFACMRVPVTRRLYADVMGTDPGWPEGEGELRTRADLRQQLLAACSPPQGQCGSCSQQKDCDDDATEWGQGWHSGGVGAGKTVGKKLRNVNAVNGFRCL
jgi:formylglycine-generating enzyme required for sulfatase activity